jgi:hypothetical protein
VAHPLTLHPGRLLPAGPTVRATARELHAEVAQALTTETAGFLAELVSEHRPTDLAAAELAQDLAYGLAKGAYRL